MDGHFIDDYSFMETIHSQMSKCQIILMKITADKVSRKEVGLPETEVMMKYDYQLTRMIA
jgi:hypothetical protein